MKKNSLFPILLCCSPATSRTCFKLAKTFVPSTRLCELFMIVLLFIAGFSCTKTAENSSVNHASTQPHDATAGKKPIYGLLPVKLHGNLPTRDNIQINIWTARKSFYIDSIVYDTVFSLNINHHGIGTEPVPYTPDTSKYKDTLKDILASIQPAAFYTIENEEQHFTDGIYHSEGITAYCTEFKAAAHVFSNRRQTFTNGGFTLPVQYWYYSKTHDEDFKAKLIPNVNIANVQSKIDSTEYEMNVLRTMPSTFINNVHLYLSDTGQAAPLLRMCNYIKDYTSHGILCNEAGIYKDDSTLISSLMTIAKGAGMPYMIFYSGDGTGLCYPITVGQIVAAEKKN